MQDGTAVRTSGSAKGRGNAAFVFKVAELAALKSEAVLSRSDSTLNVSPFYVAPLL